MVTIAAPAAIVNVINHLVLLAYSVGSSSSGIRVTELSRPLLSAFVIVDWPLDISTLAGFLGLFLAVEVGLVVEVGDSSIGSKSTFTISSITCIGELMQVGIKILRGGF